MRKILFVLFAVMFGCHLWGNLAYADGMILPETLSSDYLVVRYHRVQVDIQDNHAVTRVVQEFFNPQPFPVSGRYLFPVPPEAILSRFRATIDGQPQSILRQDPAATNAALYDVVAQRRDPSLLQYADWESLTFDLSLSSGGSRQMVLEYEEVLAPTGGLYRYRYVLSTERYSSQPLEEVSLTVEVHSPAGLASLYSSTHPVTTERFGRDRARITWEAQNVQPTEDFELFFAPADGGFGGGLLTGYREGHDHFLFLFAPQAEPAQADILPKDIVFVVDRSGSMSGDKIQQAHDALHFILGQLNPDDRFSIVGFDHRLSVFSRTLRPVEQGSLTEARRFVDALTADGNTDLQAALQAGLAILSRPGTQGSGGEDLRNGARMLVFLTDGLATAGITDETLIARAVSEANGPVEARLHVFGVGYDVNTHLLDRLAADNGGTVTYVQPGESLEAVLTGFYRRIAYPVLTDLEIEFEGLEASDLYPQTLPDLFQGSSMLVTGRYQATAPAVKVKVRGWNGSVRQEYVYRFDLSQQGAPKESGGDHDFVPRLWATRRIGALLDRVRVEGAKPDLVDEIQELGLGYGLVTPYTTLVIEAQSDGAASGANMSLYKDESALNQAWGQTTIQARVQNQLYQQAAHAGLASGANVVHNGRQSLVQLSDQSVDLTLLRDQKHLDAPITPQWVDHNIKVDRNVVFGSKEYFALAADPTARAFLQSGPNVVFAYQGETISVQDTGAVGVEQRSHQDQVSGSSHPTQTWNWLREVIFLFLQTLKEGFQF